MTTRTILYALAAMVALFVAGAVIGGVWDDNDTAGSVTVSLWAVSIVGAALLLLALALRKLRRNQGSRAGRGNDTVVADREDVFARDCEHIRRVR